MLVVSRSRIARILLERRRSRCSCRCQVVDSVDFTDSLRLCRAKWHTYSMMESRFQNLTLNLLNIVGSILTMSKITLRMQ
jgi:hypothetical protein